MKKIFAIILTLALALSLCSCAEQTEREDGRLSVVATIFPGYDFAREAAGGLCDVRMLLPPGAESHSYEPTPQDMIAIENCDLFIYLGGESDVWVDEILRSTSTPVRALRMTDCVELIEEDEEEHAHDHEHGGLPSYDEHVWTSPENAALITEAIGEELAALDGAHAKSYRQNAADAAANYRALDAEFFTMFDEVESRTIIVGDRFPMRYFAERYDLGYYAAYPGCGTEVEPSAAAIAELIETTKCEGARTVFYIEFSNHLIADSIAEATGCSTALLHTCHNVSNEDLEGGASYLSLMRQNLETLRSALG